MKLQTRQLPLETGARQELSPQHCLEAGVVGLGARVIGAGEEEPSGPHGQTGRGFTQSWSWGERAEQTLRIGEKSHWDGGNLHK